MPSDLAVKKYGSGDDSTNFNVLLIMCAPFGDRCLDD